MATPSNDLTLHPLQHLSFVFSTKLINWKRAKLNEVTCQFFHWKKNHKHLQLTLQRPTNPNRILSYPNPNVRVM